ncbi:hypothetical protein IIA15_10475 [candidate division TA06 bacterium]|nr:hypothetical protein [candidate division TA06 bacterium]
MPELVNQPSAKPTRKVTAGAVIGIPVGVVLVWVLDAFVLPNVGYGDKVPGEVAVAIGSMLSFIASYFVKELA